MWRSTRAALVVALVTTVIVGCLTDFFLRISVEPARVVMAVGDTVLLRAVVSAWDGSSPFVTWTVRDYRVGVVLSDVGIPGAAERNFEAKAVGTTYVIAAIKRNSSIQDSAIVIVQ